MTTASTPCLSSLSVPYCRQDSFPPYSLPPPAPRLGHATRHFNVGSYRRRQKDSTEVQDASFFDHRNEVGASPTVWSVLSSYILDGVPQQECAAPGVALQLRTPMAPLPP